jgi:hypothetical protein
MTFKATVEARKIKHFVDVLQRLDCEAIFHIGAHGITCDLVSVDNTSMRSVKIGSADLIACVAETQQHIGVDLDKLKKSLSRASKRDIIHFTVEDDALCINRGIHMRNIPLLNPEKIRNAPTEHELHLTAAFEVSGRELKDIIAEASDVDGRVYVTVEKDEVYIEATSKHVVPETYRATLQTKDRVNVAVEAIYQLDYLEDIAKDVAMSDKVVFEFASDHPCSISYSRGGVSVVAILASQVPST